MSYLSQFYNSGDGMELEVWVVAGGGGGGSANSGGAGRGGSGGGGGIFYDRFMVPLGSTISTNIGGGGAGGTYVSGTDYAYTGSNGARSSIKIYATNYRSFGKTYTVAGGGGGGYAGLYSGKGEDGGCGGGKGQGQYTYINPSQHYNKYRNTIGLYGSNDGNAYGGLSYYVKKRTSLNNSSTFDGSNTVLYPGYYGEHALSNTNGGGVMMQIPALLNQTTPSYYNNKDLWGFDYDPHYDIPVVSVPGHFSDFNGYANTGNGGNGGNRRENGSSGSSGFVLIRYPYFYGTISTNSAVTAINTDNFYNQNLRGYIITGTTTVTLPTS